jgi:hypothetical protein
MGGDAGLNGSAEALPQMEPVGDLKSVGGTAPGALGVGAGPIPADISTPGWVASHAASGPESRVGSTSITRWISPQVKTVE